MNHLEYKGYAASAEYDAHNHILVGRVHGVSQIIVFRGESVVNSKPRSGKP